jgi:hypothetical protein
MESIKSIVNQKFFWLATVLLLLQVTVAAQNIAITDSTSYSAKSSAMLDVQSSSKGMLVPRMSTSQRLSISNPEEGLLVYDVNYQTFFHYEQDEWLSLNPVSSSSDPDRALFHVTNSDGDTVFAVYNDGVEIIVPETAKGGVGGFAISGRSANKGTKQDIMKVTPDSTRIIVKEQSLKGSVGGFAVSGRSASKSAVQNIFTTNLDSTRIYVNEQAKGQVGGFAISGRSATKSTVNRFMDLTPENYLIGHESGSNITTAQYNSFIGYQAGKNTTSGGNNIFLGYQSGFNNTSGNNNTFLGNQAGYGNTEGFYNVYLGYRAGYKSGYRTSGSFTYHNYRNVFLGPFAGENSEGVSSSVFIGYDAGRFVVSGLRNTFVGGEAGENLTDDSDNSFFGNSAGKNLKNGNGNSIFGSRAAFFDTLSYRNSYFGESVAEDLISGNSNSFFGAWSGKEKTSGQNNSFLGFRAGENNAAGSNNVFLGSYSGQNNAGSGNVFIGYDAGSDMTGSDKLVIENSSAGLSGALIYGEFDNDELRFNATVGINRTPSSAYGLYVDGGTSTNYSMLVYKGAYAYGNGFVSGSDKRWKKDINQIENPLQIVKQLRGVHYRWNRNAYPDMKFDDRKHIGFIAQEVEKVLPEVVTADEKGYKGVNYSQITSVLVEAVKEQQNTIDSLNNKLRDMEQKLKEMDDIKKQIDDLEKRIN